MRIGINLLYLIPGAVGGTETYARELIPELAKTNKLLVFCDRATAKTFVPSDNLQIVQLPFNSSNRFLRLILEQTLLPILVLIHRVDVLLSLGYSAPFIHFCPSVVTIHDLNWYYHPEDFTPFNKFMWEVLTRLSAKFSTAVVTDSIYSAESIHQVLHVGHVTPILHATPTKVKIKKYERTRPYLFTVLADYPHKNLSTLLKAFEVISKSLPELDLIVCGLGKQGKSTGRIKYLGYVSREELAGLYTGALAFVFPSAYEGFGYPVLEAMSYGTPVISSSATSLGEVVGGGGILVDPFDVSAYVVAITKLAKSATRRREWIARGTKRSLELKWGNTADSTLSVLKEVVNL